ncbi:MAG: RIP metalloprotease RseP [Deltaproteobacteria bacterium HGW-Deltaproteobacteria-21]|nr:MAG: RIP metalloprotease RseP [Deltaproteobacteria bacterium HGW-Deltaproteobacteria-21]
MTFFFYYVLPFLVVLGVLIFFHELGHFLVAKYFGVKVLKFSLGFGYKLIGRKIGETEYLISTIPLGGYVKLLGEDGEEAEAVSPAEAERAFNTQSALKRIAIVAAGPAFNLILAWVIFCAVLLFSGKPVMTPEIGQVRPESPAEKAGLMKGDLIVDVQGRTIQDWQEIKTIVQENEGRPVNLTVKRGDRNLSVVLTPETATEKNLFGEDVKSALIGIVASGNYKEIDLGPVESLVEGTAKTWDIIKLTFLTIIKLFQGVVSIKTLGGPIMIGQLTGQVAQESISYLFPLLAIISINLGILNLLPIPILDGGLILFLLIELVARKPLGLKKRDIAQKVGLFLLAVLIVVVTINDLSRIEAVSGIFEQIEQIFRKVSG